jgi:CubicO group peptidase (beta-lactamase class C family)
MKDTSFDVAPDQRDRIAPRYALDQNLRLILAPDQSPFPAVAGTPPGVKPKLLLSIAGLYSTAQDYMRFAQMLANRGTLDGVRMLSPSSVKLTEACVPQNAIDFTGAEDADAVPLHEGRGYGDAFRPEFARK